jgi:hypothetical protein
MSKPEDPHELKSFEAKLAALVPRDDRLDRERLAFLAGQASMTVNTDKSLPAVVGWRHHPGWPAAFAAMSVLAATLFVMLLTRPSATELSATGIGEIVTSDHPHASSRIATNVLSERSADTLSARDALGGDIEGRLKKLSKVKSAPQFLIERPESPSLTPAAWRRVSDSARSPATSEGSSSPPAFWRADT